LARRPAVLIVDFDEPSRALCARVAATLECDVLFAADQRQAMLSLESERVGLVVIDAATIPDSLDLLAAIKKHSARSEVIIVEERCSIAKVIAAVKAGASDYLEKPYREADLERAIQSSLNRYENFRATVIPLEDLERRAIEEALAQASGNKLEAARLLSIGKTTLYRKLREYSGEGDAADSEAAE